MSAARRTGRPDRADRPVPPARRRSPHPVVRVALGTAGGVLLLLGVVLLVLPGPGLLLVLGGLVLLARAVPAVDRYVAPVRVRALQAAEASVATPWRVAGSVLAGLALIGVGVVWGTRSVTGLPFPGWSTGSGLILSGLILLGLLLWSHRRVRRAAARRF